jgi:hypothetical protein
MACGLGSRISPCRRAVYDPWLPDDEQDYSYSEALTERSLRADALTFYDGIYSGLEEFKLDCFQERKY